MDFVVVVVLVNSFLRRKKVSIFRDAYGIFAVSNCIAGANTGFLGPKVYVMRGRIILYKNKYKTTNQNQKQK